MVVLPLKNGPAPLLLPPRILLFALLLEPRSNSITGIVSTCTALGKSNGKLANPVWARLSLGVSGVIEMLLEDHPRVSSLTVVGFKNLFSPSVSPFPEDSIKIGSGIMAPCSATEPQLIHSSLLLKEYHPTDFY